MLHGDLDLARKLERAEGAANAAFVNARAALEPESAATWIEVAGVYAMFDGVESPLTQTFGLGIFDPVGEEEIARLEQFYQERNAPVSHEVAPFISAEVLNLLSGRGYRPIEFSSVLTRPLTEINSVATGLSVREVHREESRLWARTSGAGWSSESEEVASFVESFGEIAASSHATHCFLAEDAGEAIAAAVMTLHGPVALLAGASTVPSARRRGAQQALLDHRLRFAAGRGAELAMIVTAPGSASQRNAERRGFRVGYTRTKWKLFNEVSPTKT